MRRILPFTLFLVLLPCLATAQPLELAVFPEVPTTSDLVKVTIFQGACPLDVQGVKVDPAGTITVTDPGCFTGDNLGYEDAPAFVVGPLAAGTWTVEAVAGTGEEPAELGTFTVVSGEPPAVLGADLFTRPIPGRDAFEVVLHDVADIRGCAPRAITLEEVRHERNVVLILLRQRTFQITCSGPSFPGDVTVPVRSGFHDLFSSVGVRLVTDDHPEPRGVGSLQVPGPLFCPDTSLCLGEEGRFQVSAQWTTAEDTGPATPLSVTADSGAFWFFRPDNLELTVKVLDACAAFGHYWVFISGLTNQGVEITVADTEADEVRTYTNELDEGFEAIRDTAAFATCP